MKINLTLMDSFIPKAFKKTRGKQIQIFSQEAIDNFHNEVDMAFVTARENFEIKQSIMWRDFNRKNNFIG